VASLAVPALSGAQVGWAHQAGGFQSNGAVTVKSLAGGSYAGTQNPTGAIAKASQSAVTQPPTVIIQATASNTPILMMTAATYTGNLGGTTGADAKCVAEFGPGWKFAEAGKIQAGVVPTGGALAWVNEAPSSFCSGWTNGTGSFTARAYSGGTAGNYWNTQNATCNNVLRVACINY
jgi:hypothetical protein